MIAAEKSPLYGRNVKKEERRAIQTHNSEVIQDGIARYSFGPGRRQVFLEGLDVNGVKTDEATLTVLYNQPHTLLTYIEHPDHDGMLCRREVHVTRDSMVDWSQEEVLFWLVDQSMLNTAKGYEGNGLGRGLLVASEGLLPAWVQDLETPPYRVIARHFDNARGAEQQATDHEGYRAGWTSNMLSELGYIQATRASLEYDFGEDRAKNLGTPERNWTKVFR